MVSRVSGVVNAVAKIQAAVGHGDLHVLNETDLAVIVSKITHIGRLLVAKDFDSSLSLYHIALRCATDPNDFLLSFFRQVGNHHVSREEFPGAKNMVSNLHKKRGNTFTETRKCGRIWATIPPQEALLMHHSTSRRPWRAFILCLALLFQCLIKHSVN